MGRSFKTRARSRARRQERNTGFSLTMRVKCSHGELDPGGETRHPLTIILDKQMVVRHISTACTKHPVKESEAAVMRGLLGDNNYASCAACVGHARTLLRVGRFGSERRAADAALSQASNHLALLVGTIETSRRRDAYEQSSAEENRGAMREAALDALVRGCTPDKDRFSGHGNSNWKWDVVVSEKRIYARLTVGWTGKSSVAVYRGGGRWQMEFENIEAAARKVTGPRDHEDGAQLYTCPVCNVKVASMTAHNKSARHIAKFQNYVLDQLAIIGGRLNRSNNV